MLRRSVRLFWPILILAVVFGARSVGCKSRSKQVMPPHFTPQPTRKWTIPPPPPTGKVPPWTTLVPEG